MKRGIFTFTPNPVLDLGGVVPKVIPDEKVYVKKETRSPGGNGINAGRIAGRLGAPVTLSGFLGGGIGQELSRLLAKEKLSQRFVEIQGDTRLGITVSNLDSCTQTRLSFPGPHIQTSEKQKLVRFFEKIPEKSLIIIGGSLPPGFSTQDLRKLLSLGREKKFGLIVDCPAATLKKIVHSRPLLIKPNLSEFQEMTGHRGKSLQSVLEEARKLTKYIPLICVSSVEGGALLVSAKEAWFGRIPKIKINSVVGAGDSMVGGMAAHLWRAGWHGGWMGERSCEFKDLGDLLRWGLAASCASLSHRGTAMGQGPEIKKYYKKTTVQKLGNP